MPAQVLLMEIAGCVQFGAILQITAIILTTLLMDISALRVQTQLAAPFRCAACFRWICVTIYLIFFATGWGYTVDCSTLCLYGFIAAIYCLQLCDYNADSTILHCGFGWHCTGSFSACHPSHIWTHGPMDSSDYFAYVVWSGVFNRSQYVAYWAFSVRFARHI